MTINSPALIVTPPLVSIAVPHSRAEYIGGGKATMLFWYWLAHKIDNRLETRPSPQPRIPTLVLLLVHGVGLVTVTLFLMAELSAFFNGGFPPHSLLVYAAMILWPACFAIYFSTKWVHFWRLRRRAAQSYDPS
jgi:hypothetical protein